jgi:hypothetical protein
MTRRPFLAARFSALRMDLPRFSGCATTLAASLNSSSVGPPQITLRGAGLDRLHHPEANGVTIGLNTPVAVGIKRTIRRAATLEAVARSGAIARWRFRPEDVEQFLAGQGSSDDNSGAQCGVPRQEQRCLSSSAAEYGGAISTSPVKAELESLLARRIGGRRRSCMMQ